MIKEFAEKYRKIGWQVIPLYDKSKIPSHVNWKDYQFRMATDEEFNKWFDDPKVTGLGVITGKISGIVVVDEDSYKADGMTFEFESPLVAKTARGGKHHYFKYTEPIKTSGFRQGVNIEIKSDGGFIVLPPSVVIIYSSVGDTGTYSWIKKCQINKLPTITEAQLLPYRGSLTKNGAVELRDFLHAQTGTRHNNLRTVALVIYNRFSEKEWEFAESAVRAEALKQDPPLSDQEIDRIILDTKTFIQNNPKEAKKKVDEVTNKKDWKPATVNELVKERIADRALERIAPSTGWPELDFLIKGFIPGHMYTLTGDTNVGKTTLGTNFAVNLQNQGKRTLYIALEPDVNLVEYLASARLRKRFEDVTDEELAETENADKIHIFLGRDIEVVDDLVAAIDAMERYDLVIIDHIGYFVQSERNYIQEQANILKKIKKICVTKKCAVVVIAHLRKPSQKKKRPDEVTEEIDKYGWIPTQDDIAGAAAFKQDSTEVLIAIRKYKAADPFSITFEDEGMLLVTKTKTGPNGSVPLIFSERTAVIMSRNQALKIPAEKARLEQKEHEDEQLRIPDNDVGDEDLEF